MLRDGRELFRRWRGRETVTVERKVPDHVRPVVAAGIGDHVEFAERERGGKASAASCRVGVGVACRRGRSTMPLSQPSFASAASMENGNEHVLAPVADFHMRSGPLETPRSRRSFDRAWRAGRPSNSVVPQHVIVALDLQFDRRLIG